MLGQSLANLENDGLKNLTKTLYALKQLYAGGYHATQFAMGVTELLIIAALMCGLRQMTERRYCLKLSGKLTKLS